MRFIDQVVENIEQGILENKVSIERLNEAHQRVMHAKNKITPN